MEDQYTTVYSVDPMAAAQRMYDSPIMEFGSIDFNNPDAVLFAGMRKNGEDVAIRFQRTPAQYVRDMRAIRGEN